MNLHKNLKASELANVAEMGQTTFFNKFKKATGITPIDFVLRERIKESKVMIQKNKWSLQEIAYKTGFNSYEYFCSSFKKIEKLKPTEYRRNKIRA